MVGNALVLAGYPGTSIRLVTISNPRRCRQDKTARECGADGTPGNVRFGRHRNRLGRRGAACGGAGVGLWPCFCAGTIGSAVLGTCDQSGSRPGWPTDRPSARRRAVQNLVIAERRLSRRKRGRPRSSPARIGAELSRSERSQPSWRCERWAWIQPDRLPHAPLWWRVGHTM